MHAYSRFIQNELDARGWTKADLARRSGISEQTLSHILNDRRDRLHGMPTSATITALARGFAIDPAVIVAHAASACYGTGIETPGTPSEVISAAGDDVLLHDLERRLHELRTAAAAVRPALDLSRVTSIRGRLQINDLAQSLADGATASEADGHPELADVQRQLASLIDAAIEGVAPKPRQPHQPTDQRQNA